MLEEINFRQELSKLCKVNDANECKKILEDLKSQYNHTVSIIESSRPLNEYSCFEYALSISHLDTYQVIKKELTKKYLNNIFCNSSFIYWLVQNNYLSGGNNLLLYESINGDVYHAALFLDDNFYVSKWGNGFIYRHKKLEVPYEYGNLPLEYEKLEPNIAFDHFIRYLQYISKTISSLESYKI